VSDLYYYDYIGFVGAFFLITAYILTQIRVLSATDWPYPLMNLCGATLIMFSLWFNFNAPAMVIELFWSAISIYGMIKCRRESQRARSAKSSGDTGFHELG
jgi:choline-glycine betaine transporter